MAEPTVTETLLTIENVWAYHLLGTTTLPLVDQPSQLTLLSLTTTNTTPPTSPPETTTTIKLGSLVFPLTSTTIVGTQNGNPRGYFLKPDLYGLGPKGDNTDQVTGWVKLELSQESVENGLQARWDDYLVERGFLLGGKFEAAADEIGAGMREAGLSRARTIAASEVSYLKQNAPTDSPHEFSSYTHKASNALTSATGAVSNVTSVAATWVLGAAGSVGEFVGQKLGSVGAAPSTSTNDNDDNSTGQIKLDPTDDSVLAANTADDDKQNEKSERRKSLEKALDSGVSGVKSMAAGAGDGIASVYNASTSSLQSRIETQYGGEAGQLSHQLGEASVNVGSAAKDVVLGTSVVVLGGLGAEGMRQGISKDAAIEKKVGIEEKK